MNHGRRVLSYVLTAIIAGAAGAGSTVLVYERSDSFQVAGGFPSELPGFRLTTEQVTTVRVFDDGVAQPIFDFPATMNGCAQGKFIVRWRSLNPSAQIEFLPVYGGTSPDELIPVEDAEPIIGTSGSWESASGCEQPSWALQAVGPDDDSTLVDITVEYQVWTAAP